MAIKKDLSGVPAATQSDAGEPPNKRPRYGPALAKAWFEAIDKTPKPHAFDTRLRNSDAGKCTRAIQYAVIKAAKTNPMTPAGYWSTGLGTIVHERWQQAMADVFPNAEAEVKVKYDDGFESSGHIDLVLRSMSKMTERSEPLKEWVTSLELKTINGYGYKGTVGARAFPPGPRSGHKMQTLLNASAVDADEAVLVYLSLENLSPWELKKFLGHEPVTEADFFAAFTAEWSWPRATYEPIVAAEKKRLTRVLEYTDKGELVPRFNAEMPRGSRVMDPSKGTWQLVSEGQVIGAGSTWECGYCSYRSRCIVDGHAGPLEVGPPVDHPEAAPE